MPRVQTIPFGQISTHPLRQKLIDYSKTFDQTTLKNYRLKFYQGNKYFNLNLDNYIIQAHNFIEANIIYNDYFNLNLKTRNVEDKYVLLQSILNDDYDEYFDENGNMIFEETMLDKNDTLWLEEIKKEIKDPAKYVVLTFN